MPTLYARPSIVTLAVTAFTVAACGSDANPTPADAGSSSSSSSSTSSSSSSSSGSTSSSGNANTDPCAALANNTNLGKCVPQFCECSDGTLTRTGGGCQNGVGNANCSFGCAQHGGSGAPRSVEQVYGSTECLAFCKKLFGLACMGAETSIENTVSNNCSFLRASPKAGVQIGADAGPTPTSCADGVRQHLACLTTSGEFKCSGSGFTIASPCRQIADFVDEACNQ